MCIQTTWCNQWCARQQDMMWHLHFHFLHFFLCCVRLLYYPSRQHLSISGRNMTSCPSHQSTGPCSHHNPRMHSVSFYCTDSHTVSELLKHFSNLTIFRAVETYLKPALEEKGCDLKEVDEGRLHYPWKCMMMLLSHSFFVQWTLHKMPEHPALNLVCSPPKNLNFTML